MKLKYIFWIFVVFVLILLVTVKTVSAVDTDYLHGGVIYYKGDSNYIDEYNNFNGTVIGTIQNSSSYPEYNLSGNGEPYSSYYNADDYVIIANDNELSSFIPTYNFSISLWLNISSDYGIYDLRIILGTNKSDIFGDQYTYLYAKSTGLRFATLLDTPATDTGCIIQNHTLNLNDSKFHHVVVTMNDTSNSDLAKPINATDMRMYIDGEKINVEINRNTASTESNSKSPFEKATFISNFYPYASYYYYKGHLDEIKFFNVTLTDEQIRNLYNYNTVTVPEIPSITKPIINNTTPTQKDDLSATATYTDKEGQEGTVSFYWYVNDTNTYNQTVYNVANNSNATSNISHSYYWISDTVFVKARSFDGEYNSLYNQSDTITILTCGENWTGYNTSCGYYCNEWNKFQTYYIDNNECGTTFNLSGDNGTCYDCNYCSITYNVYNTSCNVSDKLKTYYEITNFETCCNVTNLSSDCYIANETHSCNYCTINYSTDYSICYDNATQKVSFTLLNNETCCSLTNISDDCELPAVYFQSCDVTPYNHTLQPEEWVRPFDLSTTAGVLLLFFLFAVIVAIVIYAEYIKIPIVFVFDGILGFFFGWIIYYQVMAIMGVILIIFSFFIMIRGIFIANE